MNSRATSLRDDTLRINTNNSLHPSWIRTNPTERTHFPNQYNRGQENHRPPVNQSTPVKQQDDCANIVTIRLPSGQSTNEIIRNLFLKKNIDLGNSQKLGAGRYSKVITAVQTNTKSTIAIKTINTHKITSEFSAKFLPREIECWKRLHHPHLVRVLGHYEACGYVFLTMEFGPGGDLLNYVQKRGAVPEEKGRRWSHQIISGVEYMHSRKIAHRDLKLENVIVFNEGCVKISDFGFAKFVHNDLSSTYCGSKSYSAPEILLGEPYNPFRADVWSTGVIIFVMVTDCMPYRENVANEKIVDSQRNRCYRYPSIVSLSPYCKNMIDVMMTFNWKERPDIPQCLHHKWFQVVQAGEEQHTSQI